MCTRAIVEALLALLGALVRALVLAGGVDELAEHVDALNVRN